jgi:thiosulfate reductase/polysulfide reductase chain A
MEKEVYSLCFMCSVRCPIKVKVKDGQVKWIEGNPHVAGMEGSLCPKGAAGTSLLYDRQRVQSPMIREATGVGKLAQGQLGRGPGLCGGKAQGDHRPVHGGHSVVLGERTQLATHVSKTFLKAIGSPNHFTHDALCKGSVNTACRSLFGYTDGQIGIDYRNTRHIVLYGRNIFEAISVKEVNNLMAAMEKGAKMTYIDPRVSVTATKAHRYWMIRPGTDLALNYALMHVILDERLYDAHLWTAGCMAWPSCRISSRRIRPSGRKPKPEYRPRKSWPWPGNWPRTPAVAFHYGYRGASHTNEIYLRRSILMLNALMGSH